MRIAPALADADVADVAALFRAYADGLGVDLSYQGFAAELAGLPGRYAPPGGALLLARDEAGRAVGCVALRPLERVQETWSRPSARNARTKRRRSMVDERTFIEQAPGTAAEMKRLYVAPAARGRGLGALLARAAIVEAGRLGHRELRLDTLPDMAAAQALYRALGFAEVPPYYDGAPSGTIFMARDLGAEAAA